MKAINVTELKAHLSKYLRAVRRGRTLTVYDRDTPIARLVPYETGGAPLQVRKPLHELRAVRLPPPLEGEVDSLAALLEERQSNR